MNKLVITATGDIPDEKISSLINDIGPEKCYDSMSRVMMFSTDPPSYIEIIGSIISLKSVFVASATVFFSTLAKRFAEDVYDNKKVIGDAIFAPVKLFARAIVKAINEIPESSFFRIGIAAPRGVPTPTICFLRESEEEIIFKLSCIYAVGDEIIERLVEVSEEYEGRVMPATLFVSEKGEVTVQCYAGSNNHHITFTISLLEPF